MRGISLELFQFDFDLTTMIFFIAPDGTVLGRYCASGPDRHRQNTLAGLRRAAERALDLFARLDEEREGLAGKKRPAPVARVEELAHPEIRKLEADDPSDERNCIHCHTVQEAMNMILEKRRDYHPDLVASRFPLPEQVGLVLEPDDGLRIESVLPDSAAARAGLLAGDELIRLGGQPLVSMADVTWALGAVADPGRVALKYRRGDEIRGAELELQAGWKPAALDWRTSIHRMRPFLELWIDHADDDERKAAGLGEDRMALVARGVYGRAVRAAGIREGDVIVAVGERRDPMTPNEFVVHVKRTYHRPKDGFDLEIVRDGAVKKLRVQF